MDGREAVEKAKRLKPDVVVLDYAMPVLDGIKAGREILAQFPGTAVLVYTFMVFPTIERMAKDAGIQAVIQKADSSALIAEIRRLLERNPTAAEDGLDADADLNGHSSNHEPL